MKRSLYLLLALLVVAAAIMSCSAPNAPSLADAKGALCQALDGLRTRVVNLSNVDAQTSVAEVRAAKENVDSLVEAARRANTVLQNQSITDMVASYDSFATTVEGLNADQRVGEAATALKASSASVLAAIEQAYTSVQCSQ